MPTTENSNTTNPIQTPQPAIVNRFRGFPSYEAYHRAFLTSIYLHKNTGLKTVLKDSQNPIDINYTNPNVKALSESALIGAIVYHNVEMVELLLRQPNINLNAVNNHEIPAYLVAASNGDIRVVQAFLTAKVNPNTFHFCNSLQKSIAKLSSYVLINTPESEWFYAEGEAVNWDTPADRNLKQDLQQFFAQMDPYAGISAKNEGKPFQPQSGKKLCVRYHGNLPLVELLLANDVSYWAVNGDKKFPASPVMLVENPQLLAKTISGADDTINKEEIGFRSENQLVFEFKIRNKTATVPEMPVQVLYDLRLLQETFKLHIANHPQRLAHLHMQQAVASVRENLVDHLDEKTNKLDHNIRIVTGKVIEHEEKTHHLEHNMLVVTDQVVANREQIQAVAGSVQHIQHNVQLVAQKNHHLERNMLVVTDQVAANREQVQAVASSVQPLVEEHAEDLQWQSRRVAIDAIILRKIFCESLHMHLDAILSARKVMASGEVERKQGDKEAVTTALLDVIGQHLPVFGAVFSIASVAVQVAIDFQTEKMSEAFARAFVGVDTNHFAGHLSIEVTEFLSVLFEKGLIETEKQSKKTAEKVATAILYLLSLKLSVASSKTHDKREIYLRNEVMTHLWSSPCLKQYQQQFMAYLELPTEPRAAQQMLISSPTYLPVYNQMSPSPSTGLIPIAHQALNTVSGVASGAASSPHQVLYASTAPVGPSVLSLNSPQKKQLIIAEDKKSASCCVIS